MKKHLLLLAAVALAAASQAQTTTVDNYTYDFNKPLETPIPMAAMY